MELYSFLCAADKAEVERVILCFVDILGPPLPHPCSSNGLNGTPQLPVMKHKS